MKTQLLTLWQWHRSFILGDSNWNFVLVGYPVVTSHFAATPQCDVACIYMCTWFSASCQQCFRYDRKCLFSCIYNHQITISPTSLFSANFNGNRVKNHPKLWTCPLSLTLACESEYSYSAPLILQGMGQMLKNNGTFIDSKCNNSGTNNWKSRMLVMFCAGPVCGKDFCYVHKKRPLGSGTFCAQRCCFGIQEGCHLFFLYKTNMDGFKQFFGVCFSVPYKLRKRQKRVYQESMQRGLRTNLTKEEVRDTL